MSKETRDVRYILPALTGAGSHDDPVTITGWLVKDGRSELVASVDIQDGYMCTVCGYASTTYSCYDNSINCPHSAVHYSIKARVIVCPSCQEIVPELAAPGHLRVCYGA